MIQVQKKGTVLVVDDEESFGDMLALTLTRLGHAAVACKSPYHALQLMNLAPERIDIVIIDEIMPGMRGSELITHLLRIKDDLPAILMTGHGNLIPLEQVRRAGFRAVLTKPVLKEQLRWALEKVSVSNGKTCCASA